ncbi:hypothetical protein [Paraburkholderia sp. HD33-4]|uniref:hypothetical protein n=1 Tax=Paraburkholderia sp. HD33-4 TaxID=2883242 RepID=UPI001F3FC9F2|nr:hypothetical protein [Paraburkholderia sp. HD33-4]
MAAETIGRFDRARQDGDIAVSLAFEKELLSLARDQFQFISPIEFVDLRRLIEDRNRCAHPSQVSDTEVFEASPELARLHIVNATRYVLSQPAAQGKQALERLISELDSNFFPSKRKDIVVFLRAGALARPRDSLLRNYLSILLKRLMKGELAWEASARASNALFALAEIHPEPWKRLIPELLGALIPNLQENAHLLRTVRFLGHGDGAKLWDFVQQADRLRLNTFVENLPSENFDSVERLLGDEAVPFHAPATKRVKKASAEEVFDAPWFDVPTPVIDRMLAFYLGSSSFAEANDLAHKLRFALPDSTKPVEHLGLMARIAAQNDQVRYSNQFPRLVKEFVETKEIDKERVQLILREAKLDDLADELQAS